MGGKEKVLRRGKRKIHILETFLRSQFVEQRFKLKLRVLGSCHLLKKY